MGYYDLVSNAFDIVGLARRYGILVSGGYNNQYQSWNSNEFAFQVVSQPYCFFIIFNG